MLKAPKNPRIWGRRPDPIKNAIEEMMETMAAFFPGGEILETATWTIGVRQTARGA